MPSLVRLSPIKNDYLYMVTRPPVSKVCNCSANLFFFYSGLADSLTMFAAGRVVTGIGGAGMRSLVSSLIVRKSDNQPSIQAFSQNMHRVLRLLMSIDLVPLRDIAGWRSWRKFNPTVNQETCF